MRIFANYRGVSILRCQGPQTPRAGCYEDRHNDSMKPRRSQRTPVSLVCIQRCMRERSVSTRRLTLASLWPRGSRSHPTTYLRQGGSRIATVQTGISQTSLSSGIYLHFSMDVVSKFYEAQFNCIRVGTTQRPRPQKMSAIFLSHNPPSRLSTLGSGPHHPRYFSRSTIPPAMTSGNNHSAQLLVFSSFSRKRTFRRIERDSWSWARKWSSSNQAKWSDSPILSLTLARSGLLKVLRAPIETRWKFWWLRVMVRSAGVIHCGPDAHTNVASLSLLAFERSIGPVSLSIT